MFRFCAIMENNGENDIESRITLLESINAQILNGKWNSEQQNIIYKFKIICKPLKYLLHENKEIIDTQIA